MGLLRSCGVVVAGGAILFGACGESRDDEANSPTVAIAIETATSQPATQTQQPSATSTSVPTPTNTSTPGPHDVPSAVRLVDMRTGEVHTLYQEVDTRARYAAFESDRVVVLVGSETLVFGLDGALISAEATPPRECLQLDGAAEVAGRTYDGVSCGRLSPDRLWMTYRLVAGDVTLPSGYSVPKWDQWLVDLESGDTTLIQAGLVDCGGCDGRYGPQWSASGRYVFYAEFGGDRRRFLTDVYGGTTRGIGVGNEVGEAPVWSPAGDLLVYSAPSAGGNLLADLAAGNAIFSVIQDLTADTSRELELEWPVAFDRTGALLYSPAWLASVKDPILVTTIVEAGSGTAVDVLPGVPPASFIWTGSKAVEDSPRGILAVLQESMGCEGTAVFLAGSLRTCVAGGVQGQIGPHGFVAVARETGVGFERFQVNYDIDVVSPDGKVVTVVTGASSYAAPLMVWNAEGTFLLILWPFSVGI